MKEVGFCKIFEIKRTFTNSPGILVKALAFSQGKMHVSWSNVVYNVQALMIFFKVFRKIMCRNSSYSDSIIEIGPKRIKKMPYIPLFWKVTGRTIIIQKGEPSLKKDIWFFSETPFISKSDYTNDAGKNVNLFKAQKMTGEVFRL